MPFSEPGSWTGLRSHRRSIGVSVTAILRPPIFSFAQKRTGLVGNFIQDSSFYQLFEAYG